MIAKILGQIRALPGRVAYALINWHLGWRHRRLTKKVRAHRRVTGRPDYLSRIQRGKMEASNK